MINLHKLQMVQKNETAMSLLKFFHKCREISNETNLDSFAKFLAKNMIHIIKADYDAFFKALEHAGAGYFDKTNPNIFVWSYSFNAVADQILHPNKRVAIRSWHDDLEDMFEMVEEQEQPKQEEAPQPGLTRHKGRPKGSKNKVKAPKEVLFTFKTSKGDVSFDLADTVKLMQQVEQLKQTLKAS